MAIRCATWPGCASPVCFPARCVGELLSSPLSYSTPTAKCQGPQIPGICAVPVCRVKVKTLRRNRHHGCVTAYQNPSREGALTEPGSPQGLAVYRLRRRSVASAGAILSPVGDCRTASASKNATEEPQTPYSGLGLFRFPGPSASALTWPDTWGSHGPAAGIPPANSPYRSPSRVPSATDADAGYSRPHTRDRSRL
jgi:hypothetical protein